jgi:AraC family transcriptional regulator
VREYAIGADTNRLKASLVYTNMGKRDDAPRVSSVDDRIRLIDCRDGRTREAFPGVPQVSSSQAPWDGIRLERHLLPRFRAPEVMLLEPFVTITIDGKGEIELRRGGRAERLPLSPGAICVLGAGPVPPIYIDGLLTSIFISLRSWLLAQCAGDLLDPQNARLRNSYSVNDAQLFHMGMALSGEIEQGYPGGRLYGEALITAIITHLLTRYGGRVFDSCRGAIGSRRLRTLLDYIEQNLAGELSLAQLGAVAQMSPCRFARLFKESVGLPPHQFVLRKRIARARSMLESTAAPLSEIAAELGFEGQSHFTAVFHKLVGTTPAAYRNRYRH